jgi:hypothetical protein
MEGTDVHMVEVEGQEFVFVFKALMEFGNEPMVVERTSRAVIFRRRLGA